MCQMGTQRTSCMEAEAEAHVENAKDFTYMVNAIEKPGSTRYQYKR